MGVSPRIVSLVPSTTETVFALGLGAQLKGVTDYCCRPAQIPEAVRRIGGTKTPDISAIRALRPDLVLANREENRQKDIEEISTFSEVDLRYPQTLADALHDIQAIGDRLDRSENAKDLVIEAERWLEKLRSGAHPFSYAYLIWRRPWMAAGAQTYIHDFISQGGGINILPALFDPSERYPKLSPDLQDLIDAYPNWVFLSDEPFPFTEKEQQEIECLDGGKLGGRTKLVDGSAFSWHGSGIIFGLRYYLDLLKELEHQDSPTTRT